MKIVRISHFAGAPDDCASYIGRQLRDVLEPVSDKSETKIGKLLNGLQCRYTLEPSGEYTKCAVFAEAVQPERFFGCIASFQRTSEIIRGIHGIPYTFAIATCRSELTDPQEIVSTQHKMLEYLNDPMAIVSLEHDDLVIALPKIEPCAFGEMLSLFRTECLEAFGSGHSWKFGSVTLHPPFELHEIVNLCRSQAETGMTFSINQLPRCA